MENTEKNSPHPKHTTKFTAARRPRPTRDGARRNTFHALAHSPASINPGFVEIGLVQLSQSAKTTNTRPVTMETRSFHRKLRFQRYLPKDFCTARYENKSLKKSFKLFQNPEKKNPGPILGQDRPEKNSAKCLFEAAVCRVLDRHRSTKPTTAP